MRKWFTSRICRKILIGFLVVSLVPLCAVYFYINSRYSRRIEQDAVRMNRLVEENAGIRLEDFLIKIEYISNLFFSSSTQTILKAPEDTLSLYNARAALEKLVRVNLDLYKNMDQVDQVTFVKKDGTSFDIMNSTWEGAPVDFAKMKPVVLNTYKNHSLFPASMIENLPEHKLVYIRRIDDIDVSTQELGYLYIMFDEEKLGEIFGSLEEVIQTRVRVETSPGLVLYSNYSGAAPDGNDWLRWSYEIDNLGITVTFYDEMEKIHANVQELDRLTETVILLSTVVILVVSMIFAKTIVSPIISLHNKLVCVRNGDFKVRVPVETKDELGDVGQAFNDMAEEIDRLVNQVYTIQLKENETAIAALQAQINPHFLYNTLDMIKSMADIYEAYEVGDVIVALSGVFRYATHTSNLIVTVQDELANLQNYMKIINARYGGNIVCTVDVPEELLTEQMIKVCLQPLVENCISHGVGRGRKGKEIRVSVKRVDGDILVLVSDDGVGIPAGRLKEIRESLELPAGANTGSDMGGVGLKNIHDRIQLYYGDEGGLAIESEEGVGTTVTVRYPYHVHLDVTEKRGEAKREP